MRMIFGCGRLLGGIDERSSIRLVRYCYEHGINDFDIAPCYGDGNVECILRKALGADLSNTRITTKVGLPRAKPRSAVSAIMRKISRPVYKKIYPLIKSTNTKLVANSIGDMDVVRLKEDFNNSLNLLGLGKVSTLLLHEPRENTVSAPVVDFLRDLKDKQLIDDYGTGTGMGWEDVVKVGSVFQFKYTDSFFIQDESAGCDFRMHGLFKADSGECDVYKKLERLAKYGNSMSVVISTTSVAHLRSLINLVGTNL